MMETLDPDKLPPGTLVDTFRVVRRLGGGAYGTVYLVEEGGIFYALKIARLREHSGDKRHTDERAQRELNCLLSLHHPYIARVRGHGRWPRRRDGYFYMVMDYVEGGTLARWCEDNRATAHEVVVLMDKVLEAVALVHAQGIFHRDLKPGNILVSKEGKEPVVVDFGVAHFPMRALPELTDTVLPPGTPRYTSPEALRFEAQNRRNREARYEFTVADELYALGVTLYDLLTDPQPDSHPQPVALGFGLIPTPPAHEVNERVPVALSSFTAKLLAAEPGERPVSAEAARRDLAELLQLQGEEWTKRPLHPPPKLPPLPPEELPAAPAQGEAIPGEPVAPRRWARARALAAGVVVLSALLACGVYLGLRSGAPARPTPMAEEAPRPPSLTPSAKAEPLPALPTSSPALTPPLPWPSPTPPVATPEKGPPMNTREVPEAAAPSLCSQTPPPRGTARWREWCKCVGIAGTLAALQTGCTGAQVRQSPTEECRKEAVEAMKLLDLPINHPVYGTTGAIRVQVDLATPRVPSPGDDRGCVNGPCLRPGPITSVVVKGRGKLVRGTLLSGRVFDDVDHPGEGWNIRWTEATLPNGDKHPVCLEGGQSTSKCPNGGGQICPEFPVDIVPRWDRPILP